MGQDDLTVTVWGEQKLAEPTELEVDETSQPTLTRVAMVLKPHVAGDGLSLASRAA